MNDLKCRYQNFREPGQILDTNRIFSYIDSMSSYLNNKGAVTRNFTQWPIWGTPIVNEPTPMAADYAGEIANLKQYIRKRLLWLDSQWPRPASCLPTGLNDANLENGISIYPIPTNDLLNILIDNNDLHSYQISLYDMQGRCLQTLSYVQAFNTIDISHLSKGVYFVHIKSNNGALVKKVIID